MEIPLKPKTAKLILNFLPYIFPKPKLREMTKNYSVPGYISLSLKSLVSRVFLSSTLCWLKFFFSHLVFDSKDNAECGTTWRSSSFCKFKLTNFEILSNREYQLFISIIVGVDMVSYTNSRWLSVDRRNSIRKLKNGNWTHDLPHTKHWATENFSDEQAICRLTQRTNLAATLYIIVKIKINY